MAKSYSITATIELRLWDIEADSPHDAIMEALEEDYNCEYSIMSYNVTSEEDVTDDEEE